jgi:hypothetical protein
VLGRSYLIRSQLNWRQVATGIKARQQFGLLLLLVALNPRAAVSQRTVVTTRVAATYAILGPTRVDTADATHAFVSALTADSLVKVLPPITPELLAKTAGRPAPDGRVDAQGARRLGRLEAAQLFVTLSVSGRPTNALIRVDIADVATGQRVARDSLRVGPGTSLAVGLTAIGHTAARRLASVKPQ